MWLSESNLISVMTSTECFDWFSAFFPLSFEIDIFYTWKCFATYDKFLVRYPLKILQLPQRFLTSWTRIHCSLRPRSFVSEKKDKRLFLLKKVVFLFVSDVCIIKKYIDQLHIQFCSLYLNWLLKKSFYS